MHYVYILRSESSPDAIYIGSTSDLRRRLGEHNRGSSQHTSKHVPWKIEFYASFNNKPKALEFEKYLKSHSGKAFTRKRLV